VSVARLRPLAEDDLVERTRYYSTEGGTDLGVRFFEAAVASLRAIEKMPNAGSLRVGDLCDIPGLRVRRVPGFPVGWFYFVRPDHADVVRLLSDAQDLPVILADLDAD
jgi:toxin ParE1/3/4